MGEPGYLLEVSNLTTSFDTPYGLLPAVDGISYKLRPREVLAIVGESGSGKTVSCLSIVGLVSTGKNAVTTGSIVFDGQELLGKDQSRQKAIRGKEIGMIFQEPMTSLNPVFTIGEQIDETLRAHTKLDKTGRKARAVELLDLVGIPEPQSRLKCYPYELSGGMKQRAMIAMALCCNPKVLIADEPTTALDVTIQAQVLWLLRDLSQKLDMSIILVTHDLGVVANFAHRTIVMYAGKIVEEGQTQDVLRQPLHCYTQGLISSIPTIRADRKQKLAVIPGNVPDLSEMPQGCRFSPRCSRSNERCARQFPPPATMQQEHIVYCWRYHT